jgi:ElaA protein
MPETVTKWQKFEQLSATALYELLRFRQGIFVVEQESPYPDLDGLDPHAWHLLLRRDGELIGYLRLMQAPVRIGRIAVAAELRRHGLGRRLMQEALLFCRAQYPGQPVTLTAQVHLVPFYRGYGFAPIGEPFDDFGVAHVEMKFRNNKFSECEPLHTTRLISG